MAFETAVAQAKIEDFRFHDLRHTFASRFVMDGGSVHALQKILGHATITMTMRYAHLSPDHLRAEMAKTERRTAAVVAESSDSNTGDRVQVPK